MDQPFTLEDFRDQMRQVRRLGSLRDLLGMIPGLGSLVNNMPDIDVDSDLNHIEGIINSMTPDERLDPDRIDHSRRNRIARGSGTEPEDVNKLLKDFKAMSGMMQEMAGMGMRDRMRTVKQMADGGLFRPGRIPPNDQQLRG